MILPLPTLIAIEVVLFGVLEYKRYEGYKKTGQSGFLGSFPFDPAGLDSPANREKEIKNGRLGDDIICCLMPVPVITLHAFGIFVSMHVISKALCLVWSGHICWSCDGMLLVTYRTSYLSMRQSCA